MVRTGLVVINEDAMRETYSEQRHDEGDDLQTDLDGRGSVIPNPKVSATPQDYDEEQ
jgi:hypothetical protein